jgi:4,5-DOPA dioxygenase extradiol
MVPANGASMASSELLRTAHSNTTKAPVLFVSHGAPTFAVEPGLLGSALREHSHVLDGIHGLVVISPHWQTRGLLVSEQLQPNTVHDFQGFPESLYRIQYPARGSLAVSNLVLEALRGAGLNPQTDQQHGLDHGVWVPLLHLRAQADLPVVCVSLPMGFNPLLSCQMGKALGSIRTQGIAIIGSGSMTHNLAEFQSRTSTAPAAYVIAFTQWIRRQLECANVQALLEYRQRAPSAVRAHPTQEHLLPLFVALGATQQDDTLKVLSTEIRHGVLSMESYLWQ